MFVIIVAENETLMAMRAKTVKRLKEHFIAKVNNGSFVTNAPPGTVVETAKSVEEIVASYNGEVFGMTTGASTTIKSNALDSTNGTENDMTTVIKKQETK